MSRCWIGEYNESLEEDAWRGYEYWSAQVEAEMDIIEADKMSVGCFASRRDRVSRGQTEGAGDVLPF
jgi:hypothetical protein